MTKGDWEYFDYGLPFGEEIFSWTVDHYVQDNMDMLNANIARGLVRLFEEIKQTHEKKRDEEPELDLDGDGFSRYLQKIAGLPDDGAPDSSLDRNRVVQEIRRAARLLKTVDDKLLEVQAEYKRIKGKDRGTALG